MNLYNLVIHSINIYFLWAEEIKKQQKEKDLKVLLVKAGRLQKVRLKKPLKRKVKQFSGNKSTRIINHLCRPHP